MGYEFDPNRYEGDEDSSTTEKVATDAQKDDKNNTSSTTSETNKDVDSSGGISELKVNLKDFFVKIFYTQMIEKVKKNFFGAYLRHSQTLETFYSN